MIVIFNPRDALVSTIFAVERCLAVCCLSHAGTVSKQLNLS